MLPETITVYGKPIRLADWQRKVAIGQHYLIFLPEIGVAVYGQILEPPPEMKELIESEPGFFWCKAHSVYEPDDEEGIVHVLDINGLLSAETFAAAKRYGWPADPEALERLLGHSLKEDSDVA